MKKSIRTLQFNIYSRKIPVLKEYFREINETKCILLKKKKTYITKKYKEVKKYPQYTIYR